MPVIGWLGITPPGPANPFVAAFYQGLSQTGYVEGQNVAIEYRWAESHYERLPALAADLVGRKVDLIVAGGTLPHSRQKAPRRRSQSSSPASATRWGRAWSAVSPGRAATSPASASSPSS